MKHFRKDIPIIEQLPRWERGMILFLNPTLYRKLKKDGFDLTGCAPNLRIPKVDCEPI